MSARLALVTGHVERDAARVFASARSGPNGSVIGPPSTRVAALLGVRNGMLFISGRSDRPHAHQIVADEDLAAGEVEIEGIARLVGHASSELTGTVDRHRLTPIHDHGAERMNAVLSGFGRSACGSSSVQARMILCRDLTAGSDPERPAWTAIYSRQPSLLGTTPSFRAGPSLNPRLCKRGHLTRRR